MSIFVQRESHFINGIDFMAILLISVVLLSDSTTFDFSVGKKVLFGILIGIAYLVMLRIKFVGLGLMALSSIIWAALVHGFLQIKSLTGDNTVLNAIIFFLLTLLFFRIHVGSFQLLIGRARGFYHDSEGNKIVLDKTKADKSKLTINDIESEKRLNKLDEIAMGVEDLQNRIEAIIADDRNAVSKDNLQKARELPDAIKKVRKKSNSIFFRMKDKKAKYEYDTVVGTYYGLLAYCNYYDRKKMEEQERQEREKEAREWRERNQQYFEYEFYGNNSNSQDQAPQQDDKLKGAMSLFMIDDDMEVTDSLLRSQRNKLMKVFHTDSGEADPVYAQKINEAYEILKQNYC